MARVGRGTMRGGGLAWVATAIAVLALSSACTGCGVSHEAVAGVPSSEVVPLSFQIRSLSGVMADVAAAVDPMPVYGWSEMPAGARLADTWWPVLDLGSPEEYGGESTPNPWVAGVETDQPQVQVVFELAEGWMVLIENFRGDLGDVHGEYVGEVVDCPATLYDVAGGRLVQWSNGGRWYGVFGRGLSRDVVVRLALGAQLIGADLTDKGD